MNRHAMRKILKVAGFNIAAALFILVGFDRLLLNRKLHIEPSYRYVAEEGVVVHRPGLDEEWAYEQLDIGVMKNRTLTYRVITDGDGARTGPSPRNVGRREALVVLGDSVSFGAHADYEKTLAGLLERAFPARDIANFGVCGMDSSAYGRILSHFAARKSLRPSALVVGLNVDMALGDLPRVLARRKYGSLKAVSGYLVGPEKYAEVGGSTIRRILFLAEMAMRRHFSLPNILWPVKDFYGKFAVPLTGLEGAQFPALEAIELENLEEIRRASGLDPSAVVVWFIPDRNEHLAKILGRPDPSGFFRSSHRFWDGMKTRLSGLGYRVVDPREILDDLYARRKIYPFTVDGHLNAAGFEAVSVPIRAELERGESPGEHPPTAQ